MNMNLLGSSRQAPEEFINNAEYIKDFENQPLLTDPVNSNDITYSEKPQIFVDGCDTEIPKNFQKTREDEKIHIYAKIVHKNPKDLKIKSELSGSVLGFHLYSVIDCEKFSPLVTLHKDPSIECVPVENSKLLVYNKSSIDRENDTRNLSKRDEYGSSLSLNQDTGPEPLYESIDEEKCNQPTLNRYDQIQYSETTKPFFEVGVYNDKIAEKISILRKPRNRQDSFKRDSQDSSQRKSLAIVNFEESNHLKNDNPSESSSDKKEDKRKNKQGLDLCISFDKILKNKNDQAYTRNYITFYIFFSVIDMFFLVFYIIEISNLTADKKISSFFKPITISDIVFFLAASLIIVIKYFICRISQNNHNPILLCLPILLFTISLSTNYFIHKEGLLYDSLFLKATE